MEDVEVHSKRVYSFRFQGLQSELFPSFVLSDGLPVMLGVFFTRFECKFQSSPPVSSVVLGLLNHQNSDIVCVVLDVLSDLTDPDNMPEMGEEETGRNTLQTSGEDSKLHSFRVYFLESLVSSLLSTGQGLSSILFEVLNRLTNEENPTEDEAEGENYTRNEWERSTNTFTTSITLTH